ncbi:hydrogenase 2 operon protein HybA [Kaarinaea lacus]
MGMNRREFLKTTALGAGAVACSESASAVMRDPLPMPPQAVGMLYDSTLCIGCKACMVACKQANDMPPEHSAQEDLMWDTPLDISPKTLNVIKTYRDGSMEQKDREVDGYAFMKRHCLHCVDPSCISACPVSAMTKDPLTGIVSHHADRCIGCRYCVAGCPFSVPKFELDGPFGQIQKCQFCSHLQAKGQIPACCDVCPTGASLFGNIEDLKAEAHRRLDAEAGSNYVFPRGRLGGDRPTHEAAIPNYQKTVYGEKELGGTQVLYMSAIPFDKMGLPTNVPDFGYPAITEGIQHMLYQWLALPFVVLSGLLFAVRRNTKGDAQQSQAESEEGKAS